MVAGQVDDQRQQAPLEVDGGLQVGFGLDQGLPAAFG